jgi:2-phosphosulfolactate phosphatase
MRVHVAFTPDESAAAPTGIVIDVIRATSTICQALAGGYERVFCAAEVEDARRLREELPDVTLGGERLGVRIDGFDLGNSPQEYLEPRSPVLSMSTTNGTRAIVTAAERCERALVASLNNLAAVAQSAREHGDDVAIFCAGVKGAFALDDAYVAGRLAEVLDAERSDAAEAAVRLARSYESAEEVFRQSRSGRNLIGHGPELESDIPWCARESVLAVVPRFVGMHGVAAEIVQ